MQKLLKDNTDDVHYLHSVYNLALVLENTSSSIEKINEQYDMATQHLIKHNVNLCADLYLQWARFLKEKHEPEAAFDKWRKSKEIRKNSISSQFIDKMQQMNSNMKHESTTSDDLKRSNQTNGSAVELPSESSDSEKVIENEDVKPSFNFKNVNWRKLPDKNTTATDSTSQDERSESDESLTPASSPFKPKKLPKGSCFGFGIRIGFI